MHSSTASSSSSFPSTSSSSSSFSLFSLAHRKPMINVHSDTHHHYLALYCLLSSSAVMLLIPKKMVDHINVDNLLAWCTVYGAFLLWPYDGARGKVWGSFSDRMQSETRNKGWERWVTSDTCPQLESIQDCRGYSARAPTIQPYGWPIVVDTFTSVIGIHPLGTVDICTKFHSNLSSNCWGISVLTKWHLCP